jgi:hypothetical protein
MASSHLYLDGKSKEADYNISPAMSQVGITHNLNVAATDRSSIDSARGWEYEAVDLSSSSILQFASYLGAMHSARLEAMEHASMASNIRSIEPWSIAAHAVLFAPPASHQMALLVS